MHLAVMTYTLTRDYIPSLRPLIKNKDSQKTVFIFFAGGFYPFALCQKLLHYSLLLITCQKSRMRF